MTTSTTRRTRPASRTPRTAAVTAQPATGPVETTKAAPKRRRPVPVPADVPETDDEMNKKIDAAPKRTARKRTAAKEAVPAVAAIELFLPANRHVADYSVDLTNEGEEPTRDYGKVLAKQPSETHIAFQEWVKKHVGVDVDVRTVQILISTYHEFQNSPERKAHMKKVREAAAMKKAAQLARKQATAK